MLGAFFYRPGLRTHPRELARQLAVAVPVVARELDRLERSGVLRSERIGRTRQYTLDEGSAIAKDARALFQKTMGVEALLRGALEDVDGVEEAAIFGSYADHSDTSQSDVDLLIIGRPDRARLSERLARVEEAIGREINVVRLTRAEFERERGDGSGFLSEVMTGHRIPLVDHGAEIGGL